MRIYLALLLTLFASAGTAQRPEPTGVPRPALMPDPGPHPHPVLDRSEYLVRRTALAGMAIGAIVGALQPPDALGDRRGRASLGAVVGGGLGLLPGAIAAGVTTFTPPVRVRRGRFRPEQPQYRPTRDMSRYVGLGAQVGLGMGMAQAVWYGTGQTPDDLSTLGYGLVSVAGGMAIGMTIGLLMFFAQH